MFGVMCC